ncbi:MAG: hypothetical protein IJ309_06500 [Clostridia bacterium]|nr:hypothetical protein [Clostridia bacterium]
MANDGFRRCDGFVGAIPHNFIITNFPTCPMCGSHDPYWTIKTKQEFVGGRYLFKCKDCGCILSGDMGDCGGANQGNTAATGGIMGYGFYAAKKGREGKAVGVAYMKIDDPGSFRANTQLAGKEFTLDDLKQFGSQINSASSFSDTSYAQTTYPPQYVNPNTYTQANGTDTGEYYQAQYAQPQYQAQYTQPQPQYQPQYQAQYAQPEYQPQYTQPTNVELSQYKTPVISKVFMILCMVFSLIQLVIVSVSCDYYRNDFVVGIILSVIFVFAAYVLMFIGAIIPKKANVFASIALFMLAISTFLDFTCDILRIFDYDPSWGVCSFWSFLLGISYVFLGLHFALKGKVFGRGLKITMTILRCILMFTCWVFFVVGFALYSEMEFEYMVIFGLTINAFSTVALFSFNPYSRRR